MDKQKSILIVDDDESTCKTLRLVLDRKGYQTDTAGSGREALEKTREQFYNLVLLDIKLPDTQGTELIAPLKEIHPDMTVVMVTAYASLESAVQALNEGAIGYITKPLDMDEVLASAEIALDRQRLVTEKRRAEEALRESEEKHRTLIQSMHDMVFVFDRHDRYSQCYGSPEAMLFIPSEELLGKHVKDVLPPPEAERFVKLAQRVRATGKNETYDYPLEIGGQVYWYSSSLSLHEDGESIVAVVRDITERKRVEENLRASEAQKKAILDGITTNIAFVNKNLEMLWVNKAAADSVGKTPEEMVGKKCHVFWANPEKPCDNCPTLKAFKTKKTEHKIIVTPDGRVWDEKGEPVFDEHGDLLGVVECAHDITERKRAEKALRESEARYRGVVDASPDAIVVVDLDGRITMANQLAISLYGGASEEDLIGRNGFEMIAAEDQQHAVQGLQNNLELGGRMHVEYTVVRKDGSPFPAEISVSTICDPEGLPHAFISIIRDVTKRRQAEEKIRKSEARLAEAQRIALLGSWDADRVRNEVVWSDEVYRIFGCTPQEFPVTHEMFMSFVHPDDRELVQRSIDEAVYEGKRYSIDHRIVLSDGSERIVHEEAEVILDEIGRVNRMVGTIHDITERKRAEEALEESEIRFRTLFETAPVAIVLTDHDGNFLAANEWMERISDYSREELKTLKAPAMYVHEEDRKRALAELYETGKLRDFEAELRKKNGTTYHTLLNEDLIELGGKKINIATIRDITEQKRAEHELKAAADTAMLYLDLMGHDIRNYLQAILMGADIMKHMELGAEAEPVFEIIIESVNNSQSLIKKTQSARGLLGAPVSARSLSEVLNECLRSLRATYDDVEIEMDMRVREPVVRADDYLELLLMNILENAVIHNHKRIRHVWVRVNEVERGYQVLISDNGPGLTEPKKESLFDPERRFGGVGVHQAMSIVRKYHGRISVHDRMTGNPGQGAEFLIWLPKWTYSG